MRTVREIETEINQLVKESTKEVPVIRLVDLLVEYAYSIKASDVHLHPIEGGMRVRFRIDGILRDMLSKESINKELEEEVISRIKVMAGLRTDEHLAPQDGRFKSLIEGFGHVDVRVSIMPTYYGENAVLRVLAESQEFELETLGFEKEELDRVKRAIARPYGMILANGPTGSGKTTTLYTILKQLNAPEVSIIAIEDPIEYSLEGTTQIQVNAKAGLSFASGLRSILRQDPNVVMVGEIRDEETAGIAVNAALTGHLVLSTLHTNDAATTFPRLTDMGVPPFLVASTINVVMGQRLVRRLCDECKIPQKLTAREAQSLAELIPDMEVDGGTFYEGEGCSACGGTGYGGRIGIREVLEVSQEVRDLIMSRSNAHKIKEAAVRAGMVTMVQDGVRKALAGTTSVKEILRIIHE